MGKNKPKNIKRTNNAAQQSAHMPGVVDYQKLTDAIVNAQFKVKEEEDKLTEQKNKKADEEWKQIIGYREYSDSKNWFIKRVHNFKNNISILWKILSFEKDNAKYDVATFVLLKLSLSGVLGLLKILLYILALVFLGIMFYLMVKRGSLFYGFLLLCLSFLLFFIARIVRIAQFEIENTKERGYLIGLLSAVTSFLAMVLALLALLK